MHLKRNGVTGRQQEAKRPTGLVRTMWPEPMGTSRHAESREKVEEQGWKDNPRNCHSFLLLQLNYTTLFKHLSLNWINRKLVGVMSKILQKVGWKICLFIQILWDFPNIQLKYASVTPFEAATNTFSKKFRLFLICRRHLLVNQWTTYQVPVNFTSIPFICIN